MDSFTWKLFFACLVVFYALDWRDLLGRIGLIHNETTFDPVRCAELHNLLLLKALNKTDIESIPLPSPNYADIFLKDFRHHVIEFPSYGHLTTYTTSSPLYKFLSLVRAPASVDEFPQNTLYGGPAFTPLAQPLHPNIFFTSPHYFPGYGPKPPVILLYQDVQGDKFINGIFFDVKTNLAKWHYALDDFYPTDDQLQAKSAWVPLEQILENWFQQWETGKYGFKEINEGRHDLHRFPWTPYHVEASVKAWDVLLTTIESLQNHQGESIRHDPISPSLLESENYNSFTQAFLTRARLPNFKFIAPGMTFLTPSLFTTLYNTEGRNPARRKDNKPSGNYSHLPYDPSDDDDRISLIFPLTTPIPALSHLKKGDRGFNFEFSWQHDAVPGSGLARFTVERTGGLYSWNNDEVKFFDLEGGDDTFAFEYFCPYDGRGRSANLVAVLKRWKELIESGVWKVGVDGVTTSEKWWIKNKGSNHLRLNC